ncbi:MAG: vWA domain-containing protein [Halobacteriota archaeon]
MRTVKMKSKMDDRGVSIVLEYVLLVAILSSIIYFVNITLNDQLKEGQTAEVIDNQFSDVSSQISSQLVDVMSIAPKNGYVNSKIYMPHTIGGHDFKAGFKSQGSWDYIYIESDDGKHSKYLGLGASTLNFRPQGFTYSLSEKHEVSYTKDSTIYPSAVLIPRPATYYIDQTDRLRFDASKSSAYGWWTWKLELWNGTVFEGNMGDSEVSVDVDWDDVESTCYYVDNGTALCNVTLTVSDTTYNLNDTDEATIKVVKEINDSDPDLFIKKYVIPPQASPGEPFEIHIYFQGKGFMTTESGEDLTVVHSLDTSGSMEDKSFYDSFSGHIEPNNWTVNYNVGDSFKNDCLYVEAYTTDSMSPWFDGFDKDDAISLRIEKPDGQQFYATNELGSEHGVGHSERVSPSELGNWTFKVVGAVPEDIDLNLKIYRCNYWFGFCYGCSEVDSFSTTYEPVYDTDSVELPSGYTQSNQYEYLKTYLSSGYTSDFFMWLGNDLCSDVCTHNDISAGNYSIYIAPRRSDSTYYEGYVDISKIDSARMAAITFNNGTKDDLIGLVDYNSDAYKHEVNTSAFLDYLTTDVENVDNEIKALTAGGATNIYDALLKSNEVLHDDTSYVEGTKPMIILLTDGVPTEGHPNCNGYEFCPEGAQLAIQESEDIKSTEIGDKNISICTIGFGYNCNETFLKTISSPMPGNSSKKCMYSAKSVDELIEAYRDIERSFRLAAKDVVVTDVVPSNLELDEDSVRIDAEGNATVGNYSFYDTALGKAISFNVSELYINDEIELVFRVSADEPGDYQLDVASLSNVTYEPYPFEGGIEKVNLSVLSGRCSESQRTTVSMS